MDRLTVMDDDGRIVGALRRAFPRPVRWARPIIIAGTGLVLAVLVGAPSMPIVVTGIAAFVVLIGALGRALSSSRWAWLTAALIRAVEFTAVIRVAQLYPSDVWVQTYAFLGVLALHYYDAVYRVRATGAPPASWARSAGGGWEVRLLLVCVLSLSPVLLVSLMAGTAVLAILFLTEIIMFWRGQPGSVATT